MRKAIVLMAVIAVLGSIAAGSASAATASSPSATQTTPSNDVILVNHGQQVGSNCSATIGNDLYVGFITHLVTTPSGRFNIGCILWGPPVASQENFNGLQIAPSGVALLSENGVL